MAISKACWGIDVGQCALKAIKLRMSGGELEAVSFDVIEHAKILSQPDADEQQLIRNALDKFLSRNSIKNDIIVVGVPGQASFSRFIKLPPVELKKVPEIVRYEARQQIPFNLDEVIWQHQVMTVPSGGPAELEVGIFAMKKDIVQDYVNDFMQVKITPDIMQMAPVALYNYLRYDRREGAGATLLVDVGSENTSLVIADGYRVWIRNFPLGGNNFTQALVKSFKLTFAKAENLKRHAAESKYAREVFQAMRPVFSDLLTEIQRSIGFYTSLHRESRIERVLAMGNSFRLAGLQKFLSQNLGVDVVKVEQFNTLHGDQVVNAPVFKENVLSFGVAFGLALQGLGHGAITTTLLPPEIVKAKELKRKRPYGAVAAAAIIAGFALMAYNARESVRALGAAETQPPVRGVLRDVANFEDQNNRHQQAFQKGREELEAKQKNLNQYMDVNKQRDLLYRIYAGIWEAVTPEGPDGDKIRQAFLDYKIEDDKDFLKWRDLKSIEILKISSEYNEVVKTEAGVSGGHGVVAPPPGMGGGPSVRGTPVLVFRIEATASIQPEPNKTPAQIVTERLVTALQKQRYSPDSAAPFFQKIEIREGATYKDAAGYPYERDKAPAGAAGGEARVGERRGGGNSEISGGGSELGPLKAATPTKAPEQKTLRNPWRGDDYWFVLTFYVNAKDPGAPLDVTGLQPLSTSPAGAGGEMGFGPGGGGGGGGGGGELQRPGLGIPSR